MTDADSRESPRLFLVAGVSVGLLALVLRCLETWRPVRALLLRALSDDAFY